MNTFLKVLKHVLMIAGSFALTIITFISLILIFVGIVLGIEWLTRNVHIPEATIMHFTIVIFLGTIFGQCWWTVYQSMKKDFK